MTDFIIELYLSLTDFFDTSVFAQSDGLFNPLAGSGSSSLLGFVKNILSGLQPILLIAVTVVFAFTGFKLISAKQKESPEAISTAKTSMVFVLIGAFIILSAPSIIDFIDGVLQSIGITTPTDST